jgi:hypothetical protein
VSQVHLVSSCFTVCTFAVIVTTLRLLHCVLRVSALLCCLRCFRILYFCCDAAHFTSRVSRRHTLFFKIRVCISAVRTLRCLYGIVCVSASLPRAKCFTFCISSMTPLKLLYCRPILLFQFHLLPHSFHDLYFAVTPLRC